MKSVTTYDFVSEVLLYVIVTVRAITFLCHFLMHIT